MKIEISSSPIEALAPKFLQKDTLGGHKFETNSFPTKELAFELTLPILKVEELILTSNRDDGGALTTMDEGLKRRSRTFLMSLVGF